MSFENTAFFQFGHSPAKADYDLITDRLFIKLVALDSPRLKYTYYRRFHDMAITYHILTGFSEGTMTSLRFTDDLLRMYDVTPEKLHRDALANMEKLFPKYLVPVHEYMMENGLQSCGSPLILVSNERMISGAPTILYDGVLDELAEQSGGGIFIVPSSTEEMMVTTDEGGSWDMYCSLLSTERFVNTSINEPSCVLSDCVYHYDLMDRRFEDAADWFRRKKNIR
ncbi:MAG: DUF5688 family protein [Bulleidia sp.]